MSGILTSILLISTALITGTSWADNLQAQAQAPAANSTAPVVASTPTPAVTTATEAVKPMATTTAEPVVATTTASASRPIPVSATATTSTAVATTPAAASSAPAASTPTAAVAPASASIPASTPATAATTPSTAQATASTDQLAATTDSTAAAPADLKLVEFVLANQVQSREPKDRVESFAQGSDRGFAFARIQSQNNNEVTFVWTRNGHEYARMTSPVNKAKNWRTFSSVKLKAGEWKVQLIDKDKVVLAEKSFTVN